MSRQAREVRKASRPAPAVAGLLVCLLASAAPLAACEARAPDPALAGFKPQSAVLETLLFPAGQEQVVRFEDVIVVEGKSLKQMKWDPPGPLTRGAMDFRRLLDADMVQAGTGFAKGRPAGFVQLYAPSLAPFAGHPDQLLKTAFGKPPPSGEQLVVVERPDCIVVASHDQGRISRMASVTLSETLNYEYGESRRSDEIKGRADDCQTRAEVAAMGAWGVFHAPGDAVIQTRFDQPERPEPSVDRASGLFASQFAEALPKIAPGLSKQRFHAMTAGEN